MDGRLHRFFEQRLSHSRLVNEILKEAVRGRAELKLSAVNYGEVYAGIWRQHGSDRARTIMRGTQPLPITVEAVTVKRAFDAAEMKIKYKLYFRQNFARRSPWKQKRR